ncbi:hypothetical protein [Bdellovibrio bacteriovorus]|uniref:hypothetical protein n=1 Tax=Bdellovibrio bacteriovorus TaxID=959 RepID=UPI0035A59160
MNLVNLRIDILSEEILQKCSKFSYVSRDLTTSDRRSLLENELAPYFIETKATDSWPGTVLLDGTAEVSFYRVTTDSLKILEKYGPKLSDWIAPRLPEDLVFYRISGAPYIVSIAHEGDFYYAE